jgi:hypothetical protein
MISCVCSEVPDAMFVRAQAASNCSKDQVMDTARARIQGRTHGEASGQDDVECTGYTHLKLGIVRSKKSNEKWNKTGTNNRLYRGIFLARKQFASA